MLSILTEVRNLLDEIRKLRPHFSNNEHSLLNVWWHICATTCQINILTCQIFMLACQKILLTLLSDTHSLFRKLIVKTCSYPDNATHITTKLSEKLI